MLTNPYIIALLIPLVVGYDLSARNSSCGGDITRKDTITIQSLDLNVTCIWTFKSNETKRYFAVSDFNLGPDDYLVVYDSEIPAANKTTGNFTGKLDPFLVVTFSNISTIIFHSGLQKSNDSTFTIQFTTNACLLPVNQDHAVVQSPFYLPDSQNTLTCTYKLRSDNGNILLSFDDVNLSKGGVTIWDGDSTNGSILVNATGHIEGISDVMSSQSLLVLRVLFPTVKVDNFTARFSTVDKVCGKGMVQLDEAHTLTSPRYPAQYAANLDCRYVITAPVGSSIAVTVNGLDLGDTVDEIILNDGDTKTAPLLMTLGTGFTQNGLLLTSGNKLWIRFRTDESRSGRGFNITLTPKTYDGMSCGQGRFTIGTKAKGMAASNNTSPDIYYLLHAKPGMQVKLTINDSTVNPMSWIEIWDGVNVNTTLIGYFSNELYYSVVSNGPSMLLVLRGFIENGSLHTQFITADFESVKPGAQFSLSGASGSATLLESAFNGSTTYVIINPDRQKLVALSITELYVPENATVTLYRGASDQSIYFIKYSTGPGEEPLKVVPVIYTPQARIEYQMTGTPVVEPKKILLRFSYRTISGCNGLELSQESGGAIKSPQYPNLYPANAYCSWTFTPVQNKHLRLSFSDVSLAANHELRIEADHYKIWKEGNKTLQNMTSQTLDVLSHDVTNMADVLVLMNNNSLNSTKVKVTFNAKFKGNSSDLAVASGFKINYEHLKCGGNITDSTKVIETPGYPAPVSDDLVRCVWVINLPPRPAKSNSSVNIVKFKVKIEHYKDTTTSHTTLEVRDGGSARASLVPVELKDGTSGDMLSRRNTLWILYSFNRTKKDKSSGPSLKVTFSTHACTKADQCDNGICMHTDWRCNGKDECGDDTDERDCFHATNTVSRVVLAMAIFVTFIIATALACIVPALYKRYKYPNYSELRDLMTPVPT